MHADTTPETEWLTPAQMAKILQRHRADVTARIEDLHRAVEVIDEKIAAYTGATTTPPVDLDPDDRRPTLDGKGART